MIARRHAWMLAAVALAAGAAKAETIAIVHARAWTLTSDAALSDATIVVTDGNETKSVATLDETIAAATDAGVSVYVVGIESARFTPEPLQQLAAVSGGGGEDQHGRGPGRGGQCPARPRRGQCRAAGRGRV